MLKIRMLKVMLIKTQENNKNEFEKYAILNRFGTVLRTPEAPEEIMQPYA
jgi:hypothetical protein